MKAALASLLIATWSLHAAAQDAAPDPEVMAAELEDRLHTLQQGTWNLSAEVGESYRRLASLRLDIFENIDGSRVTITHENEVGMFYRLVEATYSIDGHAVFHERDESGGLGRRDLEIYDGLLTPGDHRLSVVLRYTGEGGGLIRYLDGYHFQVRSSYAFTAPPGQRTNVTVRSYERNIDVPYTERLTLEYDRTVSPLSRR
jgi:hypothetical protein